MDIIEEQGLSTQEVQERIEKGQINISQDNISKTKKQIILEHTLTYFNLLNIFLAGIIISTGRWTNLTFMGVVTINALVGIYQELKVKKIIDQLTVVTVKKVKVVRNHQEKIIPINELVLDCVVIESRGMEVNESMLTGESKPVKKKHGNELMSGSFVVAGSGYARVIRVGNDNYSTQLVHKAKHKNKASSEMKDAIEKIIKVLSFVIVPVGIILFISQMAAFPNDQATAIVKTVGGVIGMIPEGLVLLTSLSFILGVGKLARKKALIQEMEAIEALARVNILCLDKTGTITTGELEVEDVVVLGDNSNQNIETIMGAMAYYFDDINSTQKALRDYFQKPDGYQVTAMIPFSSQRKMRAIAFQEQGQYVLGAPEFLLGEDDPILRQVNAFSQQGLRVLLLGRTDKVDEDNSQIGHVFILMLRLCLRMKLNFRIL